MEVLKWVSLVILTVQNSGQALAIRYSRVRQKDEMFFPTTAVFFTEIVKLVACILIIVIGDGNVVSAAKKMYATVVNNPMDTAKVCVPSLIYTLQNNLLYISISHLSATTFMVTYQLKILSTALFSVALLKRSLSRLQWFSLVLLFAGVCIIQVEEKSAAAPAAGKPGLVTTTSHPGHETAQQNKFIGLLAALVAVMMSGFAGVYFEKVLKESDISVWLRNVQLSILAIPMSLVAMYAKDGPELQRHGILYGYDGLVWFIVLLYALGGLTVAAVVKYADNILKGFSTSVAILLSCIISVFLFDFSPSLIFGLGLVLVFSAIYLYSLPKPAVQRVVTAQPVLSDIKQDAS